MIKSRILRELLSCDLSIGSSHHRHDHAVRILDYPTVNLPVEVAVAHKFSKYRDLRWSALA